MQFFLLLCINNLISSDKVNLKSAEVECIDSVILVPENCWWRIADSDAMHHQRAAFVDGRVGRLHFEPRLHCTQTKHTDTAYNL